jgi:hypothetical protein
MGNPNKTQQKQQNFSNPFEAVYAETKAKSALFIANQHDVTGQNGAAQDLMLSTYLQNAFSNVAGNHITAPHALENIEDRIAKNALAQSSAAPQLKTLPQFLSYVESNARKTDTFQNLLSAHPALKDFTLADAVSLAGGAASFNTARKKFPDADKPLLMATAYTIIDLESATYRFGYAITHP